MGSSMTTELESSERLSTQRYIAYKSLVDYFKDGVPIARKPAPDWQIVGSVIGAEYGVGWVGLRNDYTQLAHEAVDVRHLKPIALGKFVNRSGCDDRQRQNRQEIRIHSGRQACGGSRVFYASIGTTRAKQKDRRLLHPGATGLRRGLNMIGGQCLVKLDGDRRQQLSMGHLAEQMFEE